MNSNICIAIDALKGLVCVGIVLFLCALVFMRFLYLSLFGRTQLCMFDILVVHNRKSLDVHWPLGVGVSRQQILHLILLVLSVGWSLFLMILIVSSEFC